MGRGNQPQVDADRLGASQPFEEFTGQASLKPDWLRIKSVNRVFALTLTENSHSRLVHFFRATSERSQNLPKQVGHSPALTGPF